MVPSSPPGHFGFTPGLGDDMDDLRSALSNGRFGRSEIRPVGSDGEESRSRCGSQLSSIDSIRITHWRTWMNTPITAT